MHGTGESGGIMAFSMYKLCPDLIAQEKCFRVQKYNQGRIDELFHEHIPCHRISLESEIEALHALVDHFAGWSGRYILHSRLNKRRGGPSKYPGYVAQVEYPEEGVIRRYFSSGDTTAWSDTVLLAGKFRHTTAKRNV